MTTDQDYLKRCTELHSLGLRIPSWPHPSGPVRELARRTKRVNELRDYLRSRSHWDGVDIYTDTLSDGYARSQAQRFALQYLWLLGKLRIDFPEIDGYEPRTVLFKDGGDVACEYASTRGRKFRVYSVRTGRRLGPEHPHIASLLAWTRSRGWVSP